MWNFTSRKKSGAPRVALLVECAPAQRGYCSSAVLRDFFRRDLRRLRVPPPLPDVVRTQCSSSESTPDTYSLTVLWSNAVNAPAPPGDLRKRLV
jgi:hypothetical protein